ncbi:MAG: SH3 domain-containing protein [Sphingomonadaceae bacterium]
MSTDDAHTRLDAPNGQLALSGPSVQVEPGHLPVRGDLAPLSLRRAVLCAALCRADAAPGASSGGAAAGSPEADRSALEAGAGFDVLDMAGGWAWGQVAGEDEGFVGYVELALLEVSGS